MAPYSKFMDWFDIFYSEYPSQIASVRRSLFNNAERGKFLNQLVTGVREILNNPTGLQDPNNYHEFCRSVHE